MIYGYARVSSVGQALYGSSLETQESELKKYGASIVYKDIFTGTKADRPELEKLLGVITNGDTLVVAKMDRLGRNTEDILRLIKKLITKNITVNILNMGVANNSTTGKLMLAVLAAIAEFERDMIVERLCMGKAIKKANSSEFREGRKKIAVPNIEIYEKKVKSGEMTVIQACDALGISRNTWYRRIKE